jgi:hypothetical protein
VGDKNLHEQLGPAQSQRKPCRARLIGRWAAMKPRYLLAAAIVIGASPILLAMILACAFMILAWAFILLLGVIAYLIGLAASAMSALLDFGRVLWATLGIRSRSRQLGPPLFVALVLSVVLLIFFPDVPSQPEAFQRQYSGFLQTAAQILAALLIAIAVEGRAAKSPEREVKTRPTNTLIILLVALGEGAAMAALIPHLSPDLDRIALVLTITTGVSATLATLLVFMGAFFSNAKVRDV